jgi:hypothetical protein
LFNSHLCSKYAVSEVRNVVNPFLSTGQIC